MFKFQLFQFLEFLSSKRFGSKLGTACASLSTGAKSRVFSTVSGTITIILLGLVRAKDHWYSICTAFLGFFTCAKVGVSIAISLTVAITTGWLPRAEDSIIAGTTVDHHAMD